MNILYIFANKKTHNQSNEVTKESNERTILMST